jgi:TatD DNase family protein
MRLIDAHNHLHDARLARRHREILPELVRLGVVKAVVNGTRESDWEDVATLSEKCDWVVPSFGVHPWYVGERSTRWLEILRARLEENPAAEVGEIGLDRWIEGHDEAVQAEVFEAQLRLATELNRVPTIHCLRAWGALAETFRRGPVPKRGFLVHAFGGSVEMMREFARLGGYFSFNAYFLHERKSAQREAFREVPAERLLVETDAPAMSPPDDRNRYPLGKDLNHPGNIALAYDGLAEIRELPVEELAQQVEENFARLFAA